MERILITGASSGIGAEIAKILAGRGKRLALAGRSREKLTALDIEATLLPGDLTAPGVAEQTVEEADRRLEGFDAVIHCVGVGLIKPAADTTDAEFSRILNVNARTTFLVAKAASKAMAGRKRGLFATIPGILGKAPMKGAAAYCASKYAVSGMIKCFAQEYARAGVRFCLFHFGGVDSPFWDDLGTNFLREKMIPVAVAAEMVVHALDVPEHLVLSEVVLQPDSHQLV